MDKSADRDQYRYCGQNELLKSPLQIFEQRLHSAASAALHDRSGACAVMRVESVRMLIPFYRTGF